MSKALTKNPEQKTQSGRFTDMVMKEFQAATDTSVNLSAPQKRLAQHLFIKMDAAFKELEVKRGYNNKKKNDPPITWENMNLQKLSLDAMHRIELGLDALIENHISIIPYLNSRSKKYDVDLRIGYSGKDYYRRKFAIDEPEKIVYQIVYDTDVLTFTPQDSNNDVESYTFEVPEPLDRGKVVGGFGYIVFKDKTRNKFIPVSMAEITRIESGSPTDKFWGPYRDRMIYKTIVNIVTHGRNIPTDPEKVNASYFVVENDENSEPSKEMETITLESEEFGQIEDKHGAAESVPDDNKKEPSADKEPADQNQEPENNSDPY